MWNSVTYFEPICAKLNEKEALDVTLFFARVTGLDYLEELIQNQRTAKAFFCVDDSDDGATIRKGGAYFNRRSIVFYLLKKYDYKDQTERETVLNKLRTIREKVISRLLHDSAEMQELYYLNKDRISYYEVPGYFTGGTGGVYTIITIDEPINLCYNNDDWN